MIKVHLGAHQVVSFPVVDSHGGLVFQVVLIYYYHKVWVHSHMDILLLPQELSLPPKALHPLTMVAKEKVFCAENCSNSDVVLGPALLDGEEFL